ncbi:MAG: hypothetical protein AAFO84_13085 [Cyanobacteria bacterium J06598_1]
MPKSKASKSEKTKNDRAEMFSLLAGGLDDPEPTPSPTAPIPEPPPAPESEPEATPTQVEEVIAPASTPTPIPQPMAEGDESKQVNESTSKRKKRKKTGKRSDDAYMQTGMFLPVELVQEVKGYLSFDGNRQTIGDLTEGLLQTWADEKKAELAKRLSE